MDFMIWLPYIIAGLIAVLGFLCWEPYTAKIRAGREVKIADSIRFVDPGACFLFINWTESGDRTIGPCYIERIASEDGSRSGVLKMDPEWFCTGDQVQRCIRRTFPHPENN